MTVDPGLEDFHQQTNVVLEADPLPHLDQVFLADAPVLRVVKKEIGQLPALLYEVDSRQARDFEAEARRAQELAQDDSGIAKAECLIEVAGEQVVFVDRSVSGTISGKGHSGEPEDPPQRRVFQALSNRAARHVPAMRSQLCAEQATDREGVSTTALVPRASWTGYTR